VPGSALADVPAALVDGPAPQVSIAAFCEEKAEKQ